MFLARASYARCFLLALNRVCPFFAHVFLPQSLRADLEWLGWQPVETTYSSDRFDTLHSMAVKLIKVGVIPSVGWSFRRYNVLLVGRWIVPSVGTSLRQSVGT